MKFRREALRKLEAPEQLDEVVTLTTVPAWLLTVALTVAVAAAGVWATYGTVARTVTAAGVLLHSNGISEFQSVDSGQVMKVWAAANTRVAKGTPLVSLQQPDGAVHTVNAPWDAYMVNLLISDGQLVRLGTPLAQMERLDTPGDALQAVVFVKATSAPLLQPGVAVEVAAAAVPSNVFGTLHGRVASVRAFPETEDSLRAYLGNGFDTQKLLSGGSVIRVTIPLDTDPNSPSGLKWSKASPPFQLNSASQVTARFTVAEEHPIDWLLGR